eukprot:6192484-Pleurochrysis_carterae.AAC.2
MSKSHLNISGHKETASGDSTAQVANGLSESASRSASERRAGWRGAVHKRAEQRWKLTLRKRWKKDGVGTGSILDCEARPSCATRAAERSHAHTRASNSATRSAAACAEGQNQSRAPCRRRLGPCRACERVKGGVAACKSGLGRQVGKGGGSRLACQAEGAAGQWREGLVAM